MQKIYLYNAQYRFCWNRDEAFPEKKKRKIGHHVRIRNSKIQISQNSIPFSWTIVQAIKNLKLRCFNRVSSIDLENTKRVFVKQVKMSLIRPDNFSNN